MRKPTDEVIAAAIWGSWEMASKTKSESPRYRRWGAVMRELDGMESLLIHMRAENEALDDLFTLWQVALERGTMED